MKSWFAPVFLLALALGPIACSPSSPADGAAGVVAPAEGSDAGMQEPLPPEEEPDALDDQPDEDVPPATASALLPPPPRGDGEARLDGYGPLRTGMSVTELTQAWTGPEPLDAAGVSADNACYYLFPGADTAAAPVAFMIENGVFVRYDARNDVVEAPGGGRIGMGAEEVRKHHAGKVESQPHKYVDGGEYLRVTDVSGQSGVLVFEVDADGQVTGWRVGQAPQVDYVEGCS